MNKKIIISIIFFIIIIFLFIFGLKDTYKTKTLVCNGDVILVDGQSNQEYTFEGVNNIIKYEKVEIRLFINEKYIIDEYKKILENNNDCTDLLIDGDFISYTCNYDLEKYHHYVELEDSNHRLSFDSIKNKFEEDNFVCKYK